MYISIAVYEPSDVKWFKKGNEAEPLTHTKSKDLQRIGLKQYRSNYELIINRTEDNGTYVCEIWDSVTSTNITGEIDVLVLDKPQVIIETVKAVGANKLYLNWTVHSNNLPLIRYNLMYKDAKDSMFKLYTAESINTENTSFVIDNLENSTEYQLQLEATNSYGSNKNRYKGVAKTLDKDPVFIPNITINGFSATSVTIGWAPPPENIAEYIQYYELEAQKQNETAIKYAYHPRDSRNLPYMFDDLEPYTTYTFKVGYCTGFLCCFYKTYSILKCLRANHHKSETDI